MSATQSTQPSAQGEHLKAPPVEMKVSALTIAKGVLVLALMYGIYVFWPLILLLSLATLIAVALEPLLARLERHVPRWAGILMIVLAVGVLIAALGYCVLPPLINQLGAIAERAPEFAKKIVAHLPQSSFLQKVGERFLQNPQANLGGVESWLPHLWTVGQFAINGFSSLILLYAFTTYLLIDGASTLTWIRSFFGRATREKIDQTVEEVTPVVSAYVIGQALTSVLASVFVFALLSALKVPAALTLAVCAGLFDVLPVIGFFLSVAPSLIFASTVSPTTAVIVLFAYGTYHLFESYVLNPWIYGNRLRVSGLSILITLIIGVTLGGIVGAIVILPMVASYPIIERIWLKKIVGRETVNRHIAAAEREEHA